MLAQEIRQFAQLAPHVIDEKRPGEYMCRPIGVTEFGLVEDIRERAGEWGIHDDDFVRALEAGAAAAKLSLEVLRFMFLTSSQEAFTGDE